MVMEEMPTPRDTHVLLRGEYDKKRDPVKAKTPDALPPMPPRPPARAKASAPRLVALPAGLVTCSFEPATAVIKNVAAPPEPASNIVKQPLSATTVVNNSRGKAIPP